MENVVISRSRPGTHDPETGTFASPAISSIEGAAIQLRGSPQRYAALGLNLTTMPTLFFTPDEYELQSYSDDFVLPGDSVEWGGVTYTVRDVSPIAPDGYVVAAYLVISAGPQGLADVV